MKKSLYSLSVFLFLGVFAVSFTFYRAYARGFNNHHHGYKPNPTPKPTPTPEPSSCTEVENQLAACNTDLTTCNEDLSTCESIPGQVLPGDGYSTSTNGGIDTYGVPGHGAVLSYTDNLDGTFTDDNTGLMWEEKDDLGGIHDKDNSYTWTVPGGGGTAANGTLFNGTSAVGTIGTDFLYTLNNSCQNDETVDCHTNGDTDCAGVGGACGFAGHRDWRIPNIKELQGLVDYTKENPAWSAYGDVGTSNFTWSATTNASNTSSAWFIYFFDGAIDVGNKTDSYYGRAVRP